MKNLFKILIGIFLAILVSGNVWGQETATIGTGTSTYYCPLPGWYGYQYDVYIYRPNETGGEFLLEDCTISSIAFNVSSNSTSSGAKMTIWVKDVAADYSLLANTTFADYISSASQVYSNQTFSSTTGWNTYSFSSSFSHQAGKALLVAVRGVGCSSSGGCSRTCYCTVTPNSFWRYHVDTSTDPGTNNSGTIDNSNGRANIRITYGTISVINMTCGNTYSGTLGTSGQWSLTYCNAWSCVGEEKIYRFTPSTSGSYTFIFTDNSGDADYFILESCSNSANCVGYTSSGTKIVSLVGENTYYIIADNYNDDENASYTIRVECPIILPREQCQIGDNWDNITSYYLPSFSYYNYSLTQQIYTANEIGNAEPGQAVSISFYNSGSEKTRNIDVYIENTDKENFSGVYDWIPVTSNKLYSSSVTFTANDWTTINLTTPFEYEGGNILLSIDDNTGSWSSSPHMGCKVYDAPNQAIYIYSDGTNYDPTTPSQYSGTIMNAKNQIKLCTEEGWTLPINLLEFYATPDHLTSTPTNNIYIKTGGEWNNCEYIIYRSPDAINWDYDNPVIDWDFSDNPHDVSTNANYSENSYMEYFPIDHEPYDTTYYKLIQRDCDNTTHEYTSEIIVCINAYQKKSTWEYFTHTYEGLQVNSSDNPVEIHCHDVLGRLIYTYSLQSYSNTIINLNPPYFVTVYENGIPKATEKVFR